MALSLDDLRVKHRKAIDALNQTLIRLKRLRSETADPDLEDDLTAEINRVREELIRLDIINVHINTAVVVVQPIRAEEEEDLNKLANDLDKAIIDDAIMTASIEFLKDIFVKAREIGDLVDSHT